MGEDLEQIVTDTRLVVIDIAGGKNRDLAGGALAVAHRKMALDLGVGAEALRRVIGKLAILVDFQYLVHRAAQSFVSIGSVDGLRHHGNRQQLAQGIGAGE